MMKPVICIFALGVFGPSLHAQLAPFLDCVDYDKTANTVTAHWAYANTQSTDKTINPGPGNFFTPAPGFQGQPNTFHPGLNHQVFTTTFDLGVTSSSSWHL